MADKGVRRPVSITRPYTSAACTRQPHEQSGWFHCLVASLLDCASAVDVSFLCAQSIIFCVRTLVSPLGRKPIGCCAFSWPISCVFAHSPRRLRSIPFGWPGYCFYIQYHACFSLVLCPPNLVYLLVPAVQVTIMGISLLFARLDYWVVCCDAFPTLLNPPAIMEWARRPLYVPSLLSFRFALELLRDIYLCSVLPDSGSMANGAHNLSSRRTSLARYRQDSPLYLLSPHVFFTIVSIE